MSPNLDYYTIRKVLSRFLSVGVVAVIVSNNLLWPIGLQLAVYPL